LSAPLPTQKYETNLEPGDLLLDFHVHTTYSNAYLTPEERVDWYISQGINGAAFSDRLSPEGSLKAQEYVTKKHLNFLVILTQEYIAIEPRIHLNIYGLNKSVMPIDYINDPLVENPMNVSEMVYYVKSEGGFVTVNHYIGNTNEPVFPLETLRDWGVDGFEMTNAGQELDPSIRTFCLANNLAILAGTDEHANQEVNAFARIHLHDPSNRTISAIFTELKKNQHQVVLIEHYPERFGWCDVLNPLKMVWKFANYLLNLSFAQWIAWILWSIAGYLAVLQLVNHHNSLSSR
jgi:predicted metal-dependent phosphoesterase TrpH